MEKYPIEKRQAFIPPNKERPKPVSEFAHEKKIDPKVAVDSAVIDQMKRDLEALKQNRLQAVKEKLRKEASGSNEPNTLEDEIEQTIKQLGKLQKEGKPLEPLLTRYEKLREQENSQLKNKPEKPSFWRKMKSFFRR